MKLFNPSGFAAFAFRQYDAEGQLDVVVSARACFLHKQGATVARDRSADAFQWQDSYENDPYTSPLVIQSDLVPDKPGTDVTFLGESYCDDPPRSEWTCHLALGPIAKELAVTGPRCWVKAKASAFSSKAPDWQPGAPEPASSVPMDWRLTARGDGTDAGTEHNPIGLNRPVEDGKDAEHPAPQISILGDDRLEHPAGFAPVAPFWAGRAQYAGTYDEAWTQTRHPLLPRDFDPRFWQCAPPDQIAMPYLRGDERYELTNLHPEYPVAKGQLPGIDLAVRCENNGADNWHILNLDGVHFDWRETDRVSLTWRARFPLPDAMRAKLTLQRVTFVDAADVSEGALA
ncbi:DUF2169 domain-containing protein [Marivita sp. S0852]|uniref:DUF2169 family type VI secretion system accessory protein n=1 Tax=Marivita sp. S0852 TaxID=3373893 RepID=UPI00398211C5